MQGTFLFSVIQGFGSVAPLSNELFFVTGKNNRGFASNVRSLQAF